MKPTEWHSWFLLSACFFTPHFALLLQLRFNGSRRQDFCILAFDLPELRCSHKADAPPRSFCNQYPGNLFHVLLTGDALVIVSSALRDWKRKAPIRIQPRAENLFLRRAVTFHDVRPTARGTQSSWPVRRSILYLNRDHDFLFF